MMRHLLKLIKLLALKKQSDISIYIVFDKNKVKNDLKKKVQNNNKKVN